MKRKQKKASPFKVRRSNKNRTPSKSKALKVMLARAVELVEITQELKGLYSELDEITQVLIDTNFTEGFVDGRRVYLKDNFATKNLAWKSTPMHRHKLEIGE